MAHVRDAARLDPARAERVVVGEIFDESVVDEALTGSEAVLIAFGLRGNRTTPLYSQGTELVVARMRHLKVPRLVVLSEAAYGEHAGGFLNRAVASVYSATQRPVIRERRAQDSAVATSGLDWTIVRPWILTDGPATGSVRAHFSPRTTFLPRTSRTDLSALILDSLEEPATYGKSVYV